LAALAAFATFAACFFACARSAANWR
jgi:hypothetical protein